MKYEKIALMTGHSDDASYLPLSLVVNKTGQIVALLDGEDNNLLVQYFLAGRDGVRHTPMDRFVRDDKKEVESVVYAKVAKGGHV